MSDSNRECGQNKTDSIRYRNQRDAWRKEKERRQKWENKYNKLAEATRDLIEGRDWPIGKLERVLKLLENDSV